jgi:hypothetical protein
MYFFNNIYTLLIFRKIKYKETLHMVPYYTFNEINLNLNPTKYLFCKTSVNITKYMF